MGHEFRFSPYSMENRAIEEFCQVEAEMKRFRAVKPELVGQAIRLPGHSSQTGEAKPPGEIAHQGALAHGLKCRNSRRGLPRTATLPGARSPAPFATLPARCRFEKNGGAHGFACAARNAAHRATRISLVSLSCSCNAACFFNSEFHFHTS